MAASAITSVNGDATQVAHVVSYGATVNFALTSMVDVRTVSFSFVSDSNGATSFPAITLGVFGEASCVMPTDPATGAGLGLLLQTIVNENTSTQSIFRTVFGVPGTAGVVPICPDETYERHPTLGWLHALYQLIGSGGSGGVGVLGEGNVIIGGPSGNQIRPATIADITINQNVNVGGHRITNGADGSAATDFVTVQQLTGAIAGTVPSTRQLATTAPLAGGGALSSNLTLSISPVSGSLHGTYPAITGGNRIAVSNSGGTAAIWATALDWASQISGKPTTLTGYGITDGVSTARQITTTSPLAGGGSLSSDLTLTIAAASSLSSGTVPIIALGGPGILLTNGTSCAWSSTINGTYIANGGVSLDKITPGTNNRVAVTYGGAVQWSSVTSAMISSCAWSTITGTPTTLSGYNISDGVSTSRTISTTYPLQGGGDFSSDRTLTVATVATGGNGSGVLTKAQFSKLQTLQAYGGADDWNGGSTNGLGAFTDNSTAFAAWRAANPNAKRLALPRNGTGVYYFTSIPAHMFDGIVLDPEDDGIVIRTTDGHLEQSPDLRCTRSFTFLLEPGDGKNNTCPQLSHQEVSKAIFLESNADHSTIEAVHLLQEGRRFSLVFPDGVLEDTGTPSTDAAVAFDLGTPSDWTFNYCAVPILDGEEISAFYTQQSLGTDGFFSFLVRLADGHVAVYQEVVQAAVPWFGFVTKHGTAPWVNTNTDYPYRSGNPQYLPENSMVTIRCHSRRSFSILYNGYEVLFVGDTGSDIIGAGFGIGSLYAASATVGYWSRTSRKRVGGHRALDIVVVGDSTTISVTQGSWVHHMRDALEGSGGVRVRNILDLAVAGESASDQKDHLDAADLTPYTNGVFAMIIGANNIQSQLSLTTYLAALSSMIGTARSHNMTVVAGVPAMFYSSSQAQVYGRIGAPAQNSERGGVYRAAALHLFASLGVSVIPTLDVMGPVVPEWLAIAGKDPIMRDNIHWTTYGSRLVGYAVAKTILGAISPGAQAQRCSGVVLDDARISLVRDSQTVITATNGQVFARSGRRGIRALTPTHVATTDGPWQPHAGKISGALLQSGSNTVTIDINLKVIDNDAPPALEQFYGKFTMREGIPGLSGTLFAAEYSVTGRTGTTGNVEQVFISGANNFVGPLTPQPNVTISYVVASTTIRISINNSTDGFKIGWEFDWEFLGT